MRAVNNNTLFCVCVCLQVSINRAIKRSMEIQSLILRKQFLALFLRELWFLLLLLLKVTSVPPRQSFTSFLGS